MIKKGELDYFIHFEVIIKASYELIKAHNIWDDN